MVSLLAPQKGIVGGLPWILSFSLKFTLVNLYFLFLVPYVHTNIVLVALYVCCIRMNS